MGEMCMLMTRKGALHTLQEIALAFINTRKLKWKVSLRNKAWCGLSKSFWTVLSGYVPSCISHLTDPPRHCWLSSPFPQQRLQGIFHPIGLWGTKMPLPAPKVTTGLQGGKHGGKFAFMIVTVVAGPMVAGEVLHPALPSPKAVMVGGNTNSAIYRPSFA